ncbi:hypothetical protein, partial [Mesorhizobium sp. M1A.F.Ca.IN.020.03.1.1]
MASRAQLLHVAINCAGADADTLGQHLGRNNVGTDLGEELVAFLFSNVIHNSDPCVLEVEDGSAFGGWGSIH